MNERINAAQALLSYLSVHGVPAVICGGYARDTIFNKEIRDVDLYVSERHYNATASMLAVPWSARLKGDLDEKDPRYIHASIRRQEEFTISSGHDFILPTQTINLVGLHEASTISVEDVTFRFNLGICKAGIDENGIKVTDDFRSDYKDKQITLLRTDWGHEASLKQFIKLQSKYPWPLRVKPKEEGLF